MDIIYCFYQIEGRRQGLNPVLFGGTTGGTDGLPMDSRYCSNDKRNTGQEERKNGKGF
ncbi:hypothetical protein [Massilioclostridium coli]|uniref:hypothetical protein n=1 Tax=Massilioclostridium coli TaxID=1870991 RepID=UPI0013565A31|nr:hypothetical protein [Massilioclostridium coli]